MRIKFKHELDKTRFWELSWQCQELAFDMLYFCKQRNLPFVITATVTTKTEDYGIGRKSDTHRTGRAFDLSVEGWTTENINQFVKYFNETFKDIAATNNEGKPVLIPDINHGTAPHIHVQIHRRFAVETGLE